MKYKINSKALEKYLKAHPLRNEMSICLQAGVYFKNFLRAKEGTGLDAVLCCRLAGYMQMEIDDLFVFDVKNENDRLEVEKLKKDFKSYRERKFNYVEFVHNVNAKNSIIRFG